MSIRRSRDICARLTRGERVTFAELLEHFAYVEQLRTAAANAKALLEKYAHAGNLHASIASVSGLAAIDVEDDEEILAEEACAVGVLPSKGGIA